MAGDRDADVDPRFDPQFQRGYDPKVHGTRRPRATPRHETAPTPITSLRGDTAPRSAAAPPPQVRTDAADAVAGDVEAAAPPARAPEADLTLRHRNPFHLALLITSIVSLAAAALMIRNRIGEDVYYGGFSGTNQELLFRSQLIAALPVPLLTGGILGIVLWLAIGAIAHREHVDE